MEEYEHVVYMLKCKDNTLYTGYTNNLTRRLQMHTEGKGAKYTRGRGPFEVVFKEAYSTKKKAMQREYQLKQLSRKNKQQLIIDQKKGVTDDEGSKEL